MDRPPLDLCYASEESLPATQGQRSKDVLKMLGERDSSAAGEELSICCQSRIGLTTLLYCLRGFYPSCLSLFLSRNSAMKHDLFLERQADQDWESVVIQSADFRLLYPEEKGKLLDWARQQDKERAVGTSSIENTFYIPAGMTPNDACALEIQAEGAKIKASNASRDAELERLRAESEQLYMRTIKEPKVPSTPSDSAHVTRRGPRGGRYTDASTRDGRPYRRYF